MIVMYIEARSNLFERFVVDKASGIFGNVELLFLDVLAELPERQVLIDRTGS